MRSSFTVQIGWVLLWILHPYADKPHHLPHLLMWIPKLLNHTRNNTAAVRWKIKFSNFYQVLSWTLRVLLTDYTKIVYVHLFIGVLFTTSCKDNLYTPCSTLKCISSFDAAVFNVCKTLLNHCINLMRGSGIFEMRGSGIFGMRGSGIFEMSPELSFLPLWRTGWHIHRFQCLFSLLIIISCD